MKNNYARQLTRLLALCCLLATHTLRAQTAPTIQWQKVVPGGTTPGAVTNRVIIIKNGTAGYLVSSGDRRLLSLNPNGDITSDTPITGLFADGSTSPSLNVLDIVTANDANVVLAVQDNAGTSIQKRTTSGGVIWNNRLFDYSNDYGYTTTKLVANPDGSLICFATYQDRRVLFGEQYIIAIKLNSDGTQQWNKTIKYPGATVTIVERAIAGNNGQYLVVGSTYAPADNNTLFRGWAATISGSGDVVWQRRYDDINGLNAVAPFGDSGNAYVINGPLFSKPGGTYTASSIVIDNTGNVDSSFPLGIIPDPAFNSLATLTAVPNTNRPAVYVQAFDTPTAVRGGDMQLTAFSSENKILWSKTIGGSGRDYNFGPSVAATDNGFIVAGITKSTDGDVQGKQNSLTATWIVKLEDPSKRLILNQPTYDCSTGAITFNTTGGDGSTITYTAPGITRSAVTNNSGVVEQGLRNDPKVITITAMQSGQMTTYSFDLKAACSGTTPTIPTVHPDMQPLVDFYNATSGPSWKNKTNWLTGNSPCNWFGVSCNAAGRVTEVSMSSNNLNGTLPASLGNLSELQRFVIFVEPFLNGNLPSSLGNLSKLQLLEIEYTQISGSIPESLGNLNQLTQLFLAENRLSGTIPESLGSISNLTTLYLFGNNLTGSLPGSLANLTKLQTLHLYNNKLSGCIPTAYTALCGKNVVLSLNADLPGGGDFAAFCANPAQNCGPSKLIVLTQPTYNCATGEITFNFTKGDNTPVIFSAPGVIRSSATSSTGIVEQELRNNPGTITITAIQSGYYTRYSFDLKAFCNGTPPPTGGSLTLSQPTYDCSTGAITFNTTGGDGSTITYTAPGITRSSATSNTGTVEQGLRNDPKVITITATQSGHTATYSFDLKAACNGITPTTPTTPTPPATGTTLTLTAPTYDCSTGAITFNTSGGDGSPVEFQAIGITGWTTNRNQFVDRESRTASDVKPFTLMARQNGQVVTYTWDLKAACSRSARMVAAEAGQALELIVKGNPVGNTAVVEIRGAEGQAVQLDLLNASGHVLEQRQIEQAGVVEEQRFELQRQPTGLLFLRAQSGQQKQTVKLIKQ